MAYTNTKKNSRTVRIAIDRMSLVICVICLVLSLVLVFTGGYLAGFNSRAAITRATIRPETAPNVASNRQPAAPAPVWEQPPPPDEEEEKPAPPEAEAPESNYNHFEALAEVLDTPPQEADAEPTPAEDEPDVEALVARVRAAQQERTPPPAAPVEEPPPAPERRVVDVPRTSGGYTVQVGAFSNKDNADRMLAGVQAKGYRAEQVYTWFQRGNPVYCVWIEDYEDYGSAQLAAAQYREQEGEDAVAVRRIIRVAAE